MAEILITDDDPVVRHILKTILSMNGHTVRECDSGASALSAIAEKKPDALFLDMLMPGVSGLEVLSEIRKTYSVSELPAVLLSANSRDEAVLMEPAVKAEHYLEKPFQSAAVLAIVASVIKAS